jgi:hypothetical protein
VELFIFLQISRVVNWFSVIFNTASKQNPEGITLFFCHLVFNQLMTLILVSSYCTFITFRKQIILKDLYETLIANSPLLAAKSFNIWKKKWRREAPPHIEI